ncbi:MAG: cold shock domain-containing protein [Desulfobacterales bacterium]|nr:cold shock domain-containing protein [Desulfobacterales bacterium]
MNTDEFKTNGFKALKGGTPVKFEVEKGPRGQHAGNVKVY